MSNGRQILEKACRMHLVFVSSLLPVANPTSGFDIANRVVLDALRAQGIRVSLLGYQTPGTQLAPSDGAAILGEQEVSTAKVSTRQKLLWLAAALFNRTTFSSAKMLACGKEDLRRKLQSLGPFDGLILNSVQLPGAFMDLFAGYPSIFIAHNVEAASASENALHAQSVFERYLLKREAKILANIEKRLCQRANFVWTLSQQDRISLDVADDLKSAVLPLVTSVNAPAILDANRQITYDLGLIGTWNWRPNRAGLDWFIEQVTPQLPEDMTIAIAGELADPPVGKLHPGLRFLGRVADARAFVASCAVIPLASTAGTGVQLKTIETFEMGLPCVATSLALRGMASIPSNCTVADEPSAFAAALVSTRATPRLVENAGNHAGQFHGAQMQQLSLAIGKGLAALG